MRSAIERLVLVREEKTKIWNQSMVLNVPKADLMFLWANPSLPGLILGASRSETRGPGQSTTQIAQKFWRKQMEEYHEVP